jgi:hypothetical protein
MKAQIVVDKISRKIICAAFSSGKTHDFGLYKASGVHLAPQIQVKVDTGYVGVKKLHANSEHPVKRSKYHKLTDDEKTYNRSISSQRMTNEHAISFLKRFKIIAERYRNRRRRYGLRVNLLAGICNFDMAA